MITTSILLYAATGTLLIITFTYRLQRALWAFCIRKMYTAAIDAPSVSVCIPARNETHAMTQCLERVLASDYRKLEVIVFDDSSVDDTSVLIKSFAHAGVRFVPGTQLPDGWLGKNHALEVLAREASGSYIIFLDVDTFISTGTISQLVGYIMSEDADMVSVIPGRSDGWRMSVLFGHLRYFWELLLSRRSAPATSSSLWMLRRETLLTRFNGFASVPASVLPERAFAASLGERYKCLISSAQLGVSYEKRWRSQLETSRRLLYPTIGARPPYAAAAIAVLFFLVSPVAILLSSAFIAWTMWHAVALWLLGAFMAIYSVFTARLWARGWWIGGLLWPVVIVQELTVFIASFVGYARGTITWKGRSVTAKAARAHAISIDR